MKTLTIIGALSCLVTPLASVVGCVEPSGKLDDFLETTEPYRAIPITAACGGRVDLSGRYLVAISPVVRPDSPILLDGTFTVDTSTDPWTLDVSMTPVNIAERAPVGDPMTASSPVDDEGNFFLDFGMVTVDPTANTILPDVGVTANLTLEGCTNTPAFSCGNADGTVLTPVELPLTGSTYGLVPSEGADLNALNPIDRCPDEQGGGAP